MLKNVCGCKTVEGKTSEDDDEQSSNSTAEGESSNLNKKISCVTGQYYTNNYAIPDPPCEMSVADYKNCVHDNKNCGSNITNTYMLNADPTPGTSDDAGQHLTFCGTCEDNEKICDADWKKKQGKGTLYDEIYCDKCVNVNLDEKSWKPPCPPTCPPGCKPA